MPDSRPRIVFDENGTITAGTASPLTDGASATLICNEQYYKLYIIH